VPALLIHGSRDPRTEPGELDALRAALPAARIEVVPEGGHSPHSERAASDDTTRLAADFLTPAARGRQGDGPPARSAKAEGPACR
jgi:pimeloyl-ACP methyl ester carboxylesterase